MKQILIITSALLVLFIAGCASLNKDECKTADWQTIGYEDGLRGQLNLRVGQHREACAKHGVKVDLQEYNNGHEQGVVMYCKASRGYEEGLSGKNYNSVCPANLEADFLLGFYEGKEIYDIKREINKVERSINSNIKKIEDTVDLIDQDKAELLQESTSTERRIILWQKIEDHKEYIDELTFELEDDTEHKEILELKLEDRLQTRFY